MKPLSLALVLLLLPLVKATAQEENWLSYDPAVSRIQGKLTKVLKYGKPSYGNNPEKDEKIEVPILVLRTPIRVRARAESSVNNESMTNVSFVQLIVPAEVESDYTRHLDQEIVAAGTLVRGYKGDHFTDIVMNVKAINPSGKPL